MFKHKREQLCTHENNFPCLTPKHSGKFSVMLYFLIFQINEVLTKGMFYYYYTMCICLQPFIKFPPLYSPSNAAAAINAHAMFMQKHMCG